MLMERSQAISDGRQPTKPMKGRQAKSEETHLTRPMDDTQGNLEGAQAAMPLETLQIKTEGAQPISKRRIWDENRQFNEKWIEEYFMVEKGGGVMCLICKHKVAVKKKYNIKRHYERCHPSYSSLVGEERLKILQQLRDDIISQVLGFVAAHDGLYESEAALYYHDLAFLTGEQSEIFLAYEESILGNDFELLRKLWDEKLVSEGLNSPNIIEAIQSYARNHPGITIKTHVTGKSYSIALVTDFMRKCHIEVEEVGKLCYVESAIHFNEIASVITILMATSPAGAVPLGVIFCSGQEVGSYLKGFQLLKSAIGPKAFYGKGYPQAFIVNDCSTLRQALEEAWPNSSLLLCSSHLLQIMWQKLSEKKYQIPEANRMWFISIIKQLIYSKSADEFENTLRDLIVGELSVYKEIISDLQTYVKRKYEWSHAFHQTLQGKRDFADKCCEPLLLLFKYFVTDRCAIYKTSSVVMYISEVFSGYLQQRLLDRAMGNQQKLLSQNILNKYEFENHDHQRYTVMNKNHGDSYDVDLTIGVCSCQPSLVLRYCEHLTASAEVSTIELPSGGTVSEDGRRRMAILALKDPSKQDEITQYLGFRAGHSSGKSEEVSIKLEPIVDVKVSEEMMYSEDDYAQEISSIIATANRDMMQKNEFPSEYTSSSLQDAVKRPLEAMLVYSLGQSSEMNQTASSSKRPRYSDLEEDDDEQKVDYSIPTLERLKEEYLNKYEKFGVHVAKELSTIRDDKAFNEAKIKIVSFILEAKQRQASESEDA